MKTIFLLTLGALCIARIIGALLADIFSDPRGFWRDLRAPKDNEFAE